MEGDGKGRQGGDTIILTDLWLKNASPGVGLMHSKSTGGAVGKQEPDCFKSTPIYD